MIELRGLGISRYRSFGADLRFLAPLSKLNLLVGQNNSGKSNVLTYVQRVLGPTAGRQIGTVRIPQLEPLDLPAGLGNQPTEFALGISLDEAMEAINPTGSLTQPASDGIGAALSTPAYQLNGDGLVWIRFQLERPDEAASRVRLIADQAKDAVNALQPRARQGLQAASASITNASGGNVGEDLTRIVVKKLDLLSRLAPVSTIEAFRQIRPGGEGFDGYSGNGLIVGLAQIQNPSIAKRADRLRFDAITRFLRTVLDDGTASIEIPYERDTILVHHGDRELPLSNLGTGIHQVLMLAAACTLLQEQIVCIEEPEIHLHPILQRKLLTYLAAETSNQYLIATHSASLLDSNVASIFHVFRSEDGTRITRASGPNDLAAICADLGYRPSDLVQTNCVIWVEGPSDRTYIGYWLRQRDPTLLEGIHYSIMFYGGRLLAHLTPDDPTIQDFISLRRLNRRIAIIIDSDLSSPTSELSETKVRVRDGLEAGGGVAWVTHGYCIESYFTATTLGTAIRTVHPRMPWSWSGHRYHNPLSPTATSGKLPDKVAIAKAIVASAPDLAEGRYDLLERINHLVAFIRDANGLQT